MGHLVPLFESILQLCSNTSVSFETYDSIQSHFQGPQHSSATRGNPQRVHMLIDLSCQTLKQEAGLYHSAIGAPGLYEPTKARRIGKSVCKLTNLYMVLLSHSHRLIFGAK
ncbi:hypothetical protein PROFUN_11304 [Planoprotostelium fungivorum]|uniref:Uncharacterized protein n=1 Tax=Planoprotostelium fungivorum TaxID=1890364 RepID=A0A2P6N2J0_9EUKA|nr:hypothetical protein PROFUN_11304 [Planoprotostelium fungivorum]